MYKRTQKTRFEEGIKELIVRISGHQEGDELEEDVDVDDGDRDDVDGEAEGPSFRVAGEEGDPADQVEHVEERDQPQEVVRLGEGD